MITMKVATYKEYKKRNFSGFPSCEHSLQHIEHLLMEITPTKQVENNAGSTLTPVHFLDSPRLSSVSHDDCASRLDVIVRTLKDNYAKWQLAQKRGLVLCTSIEAIKTRALEAANSVNTLTADQPTLYPPELRAYCDKLAIIASIFKDITVNARESLRQLRALSKLSGNGDKIFYRSWRLTEFVIWTEQLLTYYDQESRVKQYVMQELPHCTNRADLIRCTAAWEYPQHVDDAVLLMFAFLAEETKAGKK